MHIVNVIQCANLGGMEQASLRLMQAMQARGHSFSLVSLNPLAGLSPLLDAAGIDAVGLDYAGGGKVQAAMALRRAVTAAQADAFILTGHNFAALLALAGIGPKRRLFAMHYHHEGVMSAWRWRLIYRSALAQFQTITFPSDYVRREAEAILPAVRRVAMTVRNPLPAPPVPCMRDAAPLLAAFGIPEGVPVIGNAGWLIERKRFDVFLKAAARIRSARPEAHFLIAGDGEDRAALEALAAELGLASSTHFTGWLADLTPFFAAIDVLLFNSDRDAFPTTPIEAMGRGIPVVASLAHGGLGEVLDSETGWIMKRHNPQELADQVLSALGVEGRARAAAARQRVLEISHPADIAETIENRLRGTACAEAL